MSAVFYEESRQAVPRCLSYSTACSLGLIRYNQKQSKPKEIDLRDTDVEKEWKEYYSIPTAVDLVAEALIIVNVNRKHTHCDG